jgi:5,10-methenyltetrahydrofolate synthetase
MSEETLSSHGFASPPCFAHELDCGYTDGSGLPASPDRIAQWRKAERERLIAARLSVPSAERLAVARAVAREIDNLILTGPGTIVSLYWPFRGELDLRPWLGTVVARGGKAALPVVVAKDQPLAFREWYPGVKMARGIWNIPIPAHSPEIEPNIVIAPVVGHDSRCFRLGYGGGFFDRTLASLTTQPLVIGVGHPSSEIRTIHPQPHDLPMDVVITGRGAVRWRDPA